ncbi:MAG: hypothetical protein KAS12_04280 [Candidatus Aenigmarchaeota archaeon]|nr:hypothetical protein [Candidatus Aenigmarchaeota archaeon]
MLFKERVKKLIVLSRRVIKDCALENGAIVAANTDKSYVPRNAANYRWVWPRDAAFIIYAADLLKLSIAEPFFSWLETNCQDLQREKRLYGNYATNGRKGSIAYFEPDQMGTMLWIIQHHFETKKRQNKKFVNLVNCLADGLVNIWDKDHFSKHTVDLWEEGHRQTSTTIKNNFTYSLAACARGLLSADTDTSNHIWKETALQMIEQINQAYNQEDGYFYRNRGKLIDKNVDSSLLGLIWPFAIYDIDDPKIVKMVDKIEKNLVVNGGVHRYQFDYYDGEGSAQEGSGGWPILNFWLSIYWSLKKDKKKALAYYRWVIMRLESTDGYIPEQIFDDFRIGVYPLAWSHAMFVIASHFLGYL